MNPRDRNQSHKTFNNFFSSSRFKSGAQSHGLGSENPSFRKVSSVGLESNPVSRNETNKDDFRASFGVCEPHNKVADMLCIDCNVNICLDCVLFDAHKDHKIENNHSFLDTTVQFSALKAKVQKMQSGLSQANQDFRDRLEQSKSNKRAEILNGFAELTKELEKSRMKALLDLGDYFDRVNETFKAVKSRVQTRLTEISDLLGGTHNASLKPDKLRQELRNLKSVISSESFCNPIGLEKVELDFRCDTIKAIRDFCDVRADSRLGQNAKKATEEEENLFQSFSSLVGDIKESLELKTGFKSPRNFLASEIAEEKPERENRLLEVCRSIDEDNLSNNSNRARDRPRHVPATNRSNAQSGVNTLSNSYNEQKINLYQSRNEAFIIRSEPQKEMKNSATMRTFSKSPMRNDLDAERGQHQKAESSKSPLNKGLRRISTLHSIELSKPNVKKSKVLPEDFQSHNTVSANRQAGRERALQILNSASATRACVVDLSNFNLDDQFFAANGPLIRSLKSVRHLIINNNAIRDTGFKQILQCVIDLKLEALSVSGNLLENRSIEFLVDFSKHNTFLKTLSMKKNRFDLKSDTLKARIDYLHKKGITVLL